MPLQPRRPRLFLSSTVQDLRDLRSAVRYFLEQFGFEVFVSENADFPHGVSEEAWRAGLETIDLADYFVLIVGLRYGSVVDEGISVTHHELRRARARKAETGRPGMVFLIRRQVLDAIRDERDVPEAAGWSGIVSLCREIQAAAAPDVPNWVHPFDDFTDVADSLRAALSLAGPLRRRALEVNLAAEIEENARSLTLKLRDVVLPAHEWLVRAELRRPSPGTSVSIPAESAFGFRLLFLTAGRASQFRTDALADALQSGEFLDFDPTSGRLIDSTALRLLRELRTGLEALEPVATYMRSDHLVGEFSGLKGNEFKVSQDLALAVYSFRDRVENAARVLAAAYAWLSAGDEAVIPELLPASPIAGASARIEAEEASLDEARRWLTRLPAEAPSPSPAVLGPSASEDSARDIDDASHRP
jgi:hypothetical protein